MWIGVLLVLILVGVVVNIVLTIGEKPSLPTRPALPCQAIPTRYILEYPECADKLLQVMNVTNVKILPGKTSQSITNTSHRDIPRENCSGKDVCVSRWRNGSMSLEEAVQCVSEGGDMRQLAMPETND